MPDITGTPGNDVIPVGGGGSLVLVLSGSTAEGLWPTMNVLVNGAPLLPADVTITADHTTGATQTVTVTVPTGTPLSSLAIDYTNDQQASYVTGDRNLYISSISLNGTALPPAAGDYVRFDGSPAPATGDAKANMVWGGTLTFSGPTLQNAAAAGDVSQSIDGGAGIDTVVLSGGRANYTVTQTATGYTVSHGSVTDTLSNVERLQFADDKLAIDMSGNAGTVAKMIDALFGQASLSNKAYVGVGLHLIDGGSSASQIADLAVNTSQFQSVAGSFSNADFVHTVANNLGYTGDVTGFISQLDSGATTKAALVLLAMDTSFNAAHLVGVMQTGIDFV